LAKEQSELRRPALKRQNYFTVFNQLTKEPNITIRQLRRQLPGPPDMKTVTKAHHAAERLLSRGVEPLTVPEAKEIADSIGEYGATPKYVDDVFDHLCAWRTDQIGKGVLKTRHLEEVFQQLELLRFCLTNPKLELEADFRDYPLELFGEGWSQDWRLEPVTWFRLCTPDLSDENKWGPEFLQLKQHMKDSPFEKHYWQLYQESINLDKAYKETAINLQGEYKQIWENIQKKMISLYNISRIPAFPEPDWEQCQSCCNRELGDKIVSKFAEFIDSLYEWQGKLEKMLSQLNQDLLPSVIEQIIVDGKCDECPQ